MDIETVIPYVFTAIGTGTAVMVAMRARDKDNIQQAKSEGEEKGFFGAKLDGIERSISNVGKDLNSLETKLTNKIESIDDSMRDMRDRLIKVESKAASAHKRIDDLQADRKGE